ncbi:hypothetical protein F5Y05DRAFT_396414 [Hypoxylon sp. FL0543]|nr:hypothetical protein F5Y05DRAFT_396414 [Hypoxylon sp. FL0543]
MELFLMPFHVAPYLALPVPFYLGLLSIGLATFSRLQLSFPTSGVMSISLPSSSNLIMWHSLQAHRASQLQRRDFADICRNQHGERLEGIAECSVHVFSIYSRSVPGVTVPLIRSSRIIESAY